MRAPHLTAASAAAVLALFAWAAPGSITSSADTIDGQADDLVIYECLCAAHGSKADKANGPPLHAKGGNGKGGGGGGGKPGGGDTATCSKTFAAWTSSSITFHVDDSGRPSGIAAGLLEDYARKSVDEWDCHSGLGETITVSFVTSASAADVTIGWGDLGTSGTLGSTLTAYSRKGREIAWAEVTMNSNQSAFDWVAGPSPSYSGGCLAEVGNGTGGTGNYDLLSVTLHEIGHALGIDHPDKRCSASSDCYAETMNSCTGSEEYMRRALNPGDKTSATTSYGQ